MKKNITVIRGDGVGLEVTEQAVRVLKAIGRRYNHFFDLSYPLMDLYDLSVRDNSKTDAIINSCLQSDSILLVPSQTIKPGKDSSGKVKYGNDSLSIKKLLHFQAKGLSVKMCKSLYYLSPLKEDRLIGVDFMIFSESTSDLEFSIQEKEVGVTGNAKPNMCNSLAIDFVVKSAFEAALRRKHHLTFINNADGLEDSLMWKKTVQQYSVTYPEIEVDYMLGDTAVMQLMLNPSRYDVILTESEFGAILFDEANALTGTPGLIPSFSIGENFALFEPMFAPNQGAGLDSTNPVGAILSVALMMDHFELFEEAQKIRDAVEWTISNGFVTKDIDAMNSYGTSSVGELICQFISDDIPHRFNLNNIAFGQMTII